jgi:hypothetical protein
MSPHFQQAATTALRPSGFKLLRAEPRQDRTLGWLQERSGRRLDLNDPALPTGTSAL